MAGEPKGLRAISPVLLCGIALELAWRLFAIGWVESHEVREIFVGRFIFVDLAMMFVVPFLVAWGAYDLGARLSGRARLGMFVVAGGFACGVALELVGIGLRVAHMADRSWVAYLQEYGDFASAFAAGVGACIAVTTVQLPVAVALGVVAGVCSGPPPLVDWMFHQVGTPATRIVIGNALRLGSIAVIAVATLLLSRGGPIQDARRASSGLRRAGIAVWVWLIWTGVATLFLVIAMSNRGSESEASLALFGQHCANVVLFGWFAFGALQAARSDLAELPRGVLVVSAAIAMLCAAIGAVRIPLLYEIYYGELAKLAYVGELQARALSQFSILVPLLEALALALAGYAVWTFAVRRQHDELTTQATAKLPGFVALMLCNLLVVNWFMQKAASRDSAMMLMLGAGGALVWAHALIAMLYGRAADVIDRSDGGASLPAAKIISSGS